MAPKIAFLFAGMLDIAEADFAVNKLSTDEQLKVLQFALWRLEQQQDWQRDQLFAELKNLAEKMDIKLQLFLAPIFVAVAGTTASFSVNDAMELLGPDMSRARLRHAIDILGGVTKKQAKKLEKEFASL